MLNEHTAACMFKGCDTSAINRLFLRHTTAPRHTMDQPLFFHGDWLFFERTDRCRKRRIF